MIASQDNQQKFIVTEPLDGYGETGEKVVWEAIKRAFLERECLAYWRYPIFSQTSKNRKEPDILIADFELGLIIIEVKAITLEQIVNINGHRWQYQDYHTDYGNPYQQAEKQLFSLLEYTSPEPSLHKKIPGRVLLALPLISEAQWQARNYHQLPYIPPILFQDHLPLSNLGEKSGVLLMEKISNTSPVISGSQLTLKQWNLLLSIISGKSVFTQPHHRVLTPPQTRGKILAKLRSHLSNFDIQQETIGKQIPPGCQRIRGIAGSGKTVLLCQKAAVMHLKYPHWKIALVFFSRSLYHLIIKQVDQWLKYFSQNQLTYNPKNPNLLILHAWGSQQQPGLYSTICKLAGITGLSVNETISKQPQESLAEACIYLLKTAAIPQVFDAILIDEGQDLIVNNNKFAEQQPFYWMAYQALHSCDPLNPEQKRLIWAYDEAQSLDCLKIPTAGEIFGENLGHLVTGSYPNGIKKTQIIYRCYRNPHLIITAAHGISMGLLRPRGMLTGMTNKAEWEAIGYNIEGEFIPGQRITIKRDHCNSPNPIPQLWQDSLINFYTYSSRQQELSALAKQIIHNLRYDGLRPSQEILVLVLGTFFEGMQLETHVARFLLRQGIDIFLPGTEQGNILQPQPAQSNPNKFWEEGCITISRVHRAKGHEADMVYIIGLDQIAKDESNLYLRNQLLVALTRARAWVNISGIGNYGMYQEMRQVIASKDQFTFIFKHSPKREINVTDAAELLKRYALGGRNFCNVDLQGAQLAEICLKNANLIGANLQSANLQNAQLDGVKLIAANLSNANLQGASLRKAKLIGATLTGAILDNIDWTGADLNDVNF
jgi:superfamily I DNA and RNA helicase